jgi:hypothetical protein
MGSADAENSYCKSFITPCLGSRCYLDLWVATPAGETLNVTRERFRITTVRFSREQIATGHPYCAATSVS